MWNPDGHRLPSWVEDAYEVLASEIREYGDGMPRDDAKTVLADREQLELTPTDATHAVDQLLDRGYLYEVDGDLFVTDTEA